MKAKIKQSDNAAIQAKQQRRANRLNSIKNGIEAGAMKEWEQMFAIISETSMSNELGISFYAFKKKCKDPSDFTIKEIMRLAVLIGVKYDTMHGFLMQMVKAKSKSRIFRD